MTDSIPPDEDEYFLHELGSFNPITLELKVESDGPIEPGTEEARTYFHEFVHLLQALGSTYCIDHHFETMNYIATAVADMGGLSELVLSGLSTAEVTPDNIRERLRFRRESLEGAYGSRRVDRLEFGDGSRPVELDESLGEGRETFGMCKFNEERLCWEYIRWNEHDRCFFATPIGAVALRETQAYALQHLLELESDAEVAIPYGTEAPSSSDAHVYTALLELFFRSFNDHKVAPEDKLATLLIVVDMALQIPPTSYWDHTDSVPMTIPGLRFMTFFEHLPEVGFVDHRDDADYFRFTEDLCALLDWPTPRAIWEEFRQGGETVLESVWEFVRSSIDADPAALERYIDRRFDIKRFSIGGRDPPTQDYIEHMKTAFREYPLGYSGYLGVGVLDAIGRALKLRLEEPLAFVFPQRQDSIDLLHAELKPPFLYYGDKTSIDLRSVALPLLEDIQGIRHLWAITLQWAAGRHRDLVCGNRLFDLTCRDPSCREAPCPTWTPGTVYPGTLCTFADVLRYYKLSSTVGD